jgi:hypothetical protein
MLGYLDDPGNRLRFEEILMIGGEIIQQVQFGHSRESRR